MVLIGECDPVFGEQLEQVYRAATESDPSVQRMNFVNAEICKIAVNTFVTTKISYANMLADLCDHLEGADVDVDLERSRRRHADRRQVFEGRCRLWRPVLSARQQGVCRVGSVARRPV